jgi:hypothetical protein
LLNFLISIISYKPFQLYSRLRIILFGRKKIKFQFHNEFNILKNTKLLETAKNCKNSDYAIKSNNLLFKDRILFLGELEANTNDFFNNSFFKEEDNLKKYELSYLNCFSNLIFCNDQVLLTQQINSLNTIYDDSHKMSFNHSFWYPYSVSSRIINVSILIAHLQKIKFSEDMIKPILNNLNNDYQYLKRNIEFDSDGNHLLKNYISLLIGSIFFEESKTSSFYRNLLNTLKIQLLDSGMHYEKSFDYHNSLFYDLSLTFSLLEESMIDTKVLKNYLEKMFSFSKKLLRNEKILFNDSFKNFHFDTKMMIDYLSNKFTYNDNIDIFPPLKSFKLDDIELIAYVSDVNPKYCPAHLHDSIGTYEMWFKNLKFITDSGNYDYNNNKNRLYYRSTFAHNLSTCSLNGQSTIFKPFRYGLTAKLEYVKDLKNKFEIAFSEIDGIFSRNKILRRFNINENSISIEDCTNRKNSLSFIHLSPDVEIKKLTKYKYLLLKNDLIINLDIDKSINDSFIIETPYANQFFKQKFKQTIKIKFNNSLRYSYINKN